MDRDAKAERAGGRLVVRRSAALVLLAAWACGEASTGPEAGRTFELGPGDSAWFDEIDTSVRFARVSQDSRCPLRAQCVWAGDGAVLLSLEPADGEPATTVLHTNSAVGPERIDLSGYELRLLELSPYPEDGPIPPDAYRVKLLLVGR